MAQQMPLPLTVSCFSKIHIGFTFLVLAFVGSPRQRAVKWVCVCVLLLLIKIMLSAPQIRALHLTIVHIIKCLYVCSYLAVSMCGR